MPDTTVQKTCQLSKETFHVTEEEQNFLKKMGLKMPLHTPKVRSAMRLAFRNERNLFLRKCDFSGETMLSIYDQNQPFPVYKYDHWITDNWEPPSLPYDTNRPFFEQFNELQKLVPRVNLFAPYNENCDYVNAAEKNKNCYMHILADRCEDCYYTHGIFGSRDCIDCAFIFDSELCYDSVDCRKLYHGRSCFLCDNSSDLTFCFDMKGCSNCFFSWGLRNQKYCIENKQYSKEEYEQKMKQINLGSRKTYNEYRQRFVEEVIKKHPYTRMINTENCTGNFLQNCKNCHECFDVEDAEDCSYYRIGANGCKDVHHSHAIVDGSQLIYNCVSTTESYNCHNVIGCWTTKDSCYSQFLQGCSDCIGCISLRRRKNCILNKEYPRAEYEKLKKHIMDELGDYWGSPFPLDLAPFTYQTSAFRDYESMTKEEVENIGWKYGETEETQTANAPAHASPDLPDDVEFAPDKIDKTFTCPESGKQFKLIPQEIRLLKKIQAPLPTHHHEVRFRERVQFRKHN